MTRNEAKKLLPIIEAYITGKDIQKKESGTWMDIDPNLEEFAIEYRIKPEPVTVYCMMNDNGHTLSFFNDKGNLRKHVKEMLKDEKRYEAYVKMIEELDICTFEFVNLNKEKLDKFLKEMYEDSR